MPRFGRHNIPGEEPLNPNIPYRPGSGPSIPNYYGDYVRRIFFGAAAFMLILSPFIAPVLPGILPFEIVAAVVLVVLGALTSPLKQLSIIADAVAAGAGVALFEILALTLYNNGAFLAFAMHQILAITFLAALYFSLKTLRNMQSDRIGKRDTVGDFYHQEEKTMIGDGDSPNI